MDFEIKGNVLVRYTGNDERVVIPEQVTVIEDEAFSENLGLKEVVFPKGLEKIGREAFNECVSLERVVFPDSLVIIDDWAFSGCISLKEIVCPPRLVKIGFCAFSDCENLISVELNDGLKKIDNGAFGYTGLRKIAIPDSVRLDECIFEYCPSLRLVKLPANAEVIKKNTFFNCKSLEEIDLPESVRSVEHGAFYNCRRLPQEIKDRVKALNPDCFEADPNEDYEFEEERKIEEPNLSYTVGGKKYVQNDSSDDGVYSYENDAQVCSSLCVDADKPLSEVIDREERLYEEQKPKKSAFMASAYTSMLLFVIVWTAVDGTIVLAMLFLGAFITNPVTLLVLPFFAVHMTPVWIWINGIRKRKKEYKSLSYGISDKNVYKKRAGLLEYMDLCSIYSIDYLTKKEKPYGLALTAQNGAVMKLESLVSPDDFKGTVERLQERAKSENR